MATTLLTLRDAIAETILAISPSYAERRDQTWHRVRSIREVAEGAPRTFMVRCLASTEDTEKWYGDGLGAGSIVQVWTSYMGVEDDGDGPMIDEDGRQIYTHLASIVDPTTSGLISFQPLGWSYEDETPGKVRGFHGLLMSFIQSDGA